MTDTFQSKNLAVPALALAASLMLAGCGGGGSSYTPTPTPTPAPSPAPTPAPTPTPTPSPSPTCSFDIVGDTTIEAGKTASATTVPTCAGMIRDVSWSQTGGAGMVLLDTRSPTMAFEPNTPGTITLKADVTLADGSTVSKSTNVAVTAAPTHPWLTVRADHSVREDADTSVRAWPTLLAGETVTSITWTQVSGPNVTMDTSDNRVLMFTAPTVPADSVSDVVTLKFHAAMLTSRGNQDSDDVTISVERAHNYNWTRNHDDAFFPGAARVHPYRPVSAYASVLASCVYDTGLFYDDAGNNNFCTAAKLPLLDQEAGPGNVPTVAQVMGRVLVSHDFLGANFEQFLQFQDPNGDFRRMLGAVNTIVIGSHVRPSFYQSATGAIYLDADNLWLTPQQRDVVTEVPDYRSEFGSALNFSGLGRMVKNNDYAKRSFPVNQRIERQPEELIFKIGDLMYHELGHAGDFFPPGNRNLNPNKSTWENVVDRLTAKSLPSDELATTYPLRSQEMKGLGQVLYRGATANATQRGYSATDVGGFFGGDVASDDYAYSINGTSNSREDLAMLMEEFMMSYRHGVQFDFAYTNPITDNTTASDLFVAWGQRGRINAPGVNPRIKLVLKRIAPWIDPNAVDTLPATVQMPVGRSWAQNVVLGSTPGTAALRKALSPEQAAQRLRDDRKRARH
ncbi:MAG: hypothetical protein V4582_21695 [Pseudomonadota bacterium]